MAFSESEEQRTRAGIGQEKVTKLNEEVKIKQLGDERRGSERVIEKEWRVQQTEQKINHPVIKRRPGEEMPGLVNRVQYMGSQHASNTALFRGKTHHDFFIVFSGLALEADFISASKRNCVNTLRLPCKPSNTDLPSFS